jgi:UDP-3-O-[3-hydroxymyristoyl] glucosamine N-acyltransferase
MPSLTVAQIAVLCGVEAEGEASRLISGANSIEEATSDDLAFADNHKAFATAAQSNAGCLLVPPSFQAQGGWALIRVENPRAAFVQTLPALYPVARPSPGVHPTALVAESAIVPADCHVGAYVIIGEGTKIGEASIISDGCRIDDDVTIGPGSQLYPNVTIYRGVRIGARAVLHAGCVIGADGFGFSLVGDHWEKFPQVGTVWIGDDVEIGANSCVDRAALGRTIIGDGTKIDNLVHVAHNCTIGRHVVIAAQCGFSGGVIVGDYAAFGGQVGVALKAKIDSRAEIGAKTGIVSGQHVPAGQPVWGMPARPLRQHLRGLANVAKLPETHEEIKEIKKRLDALEAEGTKTKK